MVADSGFARSRGARGPEELPKYASELGEVGKGAVEGRDLLTHEIEDVGTGAAAGPAYLHNFLDLVEAEPEASRLTYEGNRCQGLRPVDSIAGRRAARRRKDPRSLVQAQSLSTDAALRRDLPDQEAISSHACRVNLVSGGKVKSLFEGESREGANRSGRSGHPRSQRKVALYAAARLVSALRRYAMKKICS